MTNDQLLRRARIYYELHGFLPCDIILQLVDRGYDAQALERKWTGGDDD